MTVEVSNFFFKIMKNLSFELEEATKDYEGHVFFKELLKEVLIDEAAKVNVCRAYYTVLD